MGERLQSRLRDLARSLVGALLLGLPLLYTMETWWLAWRLPAWLILAYALGGLAAISVCFHLVGFHPAQRERDLDTRQEIGDFVELLATSLVAGFLVLLLFGIIDTGSTWGEIARLSMIQVVPLGFGAALTNRALSAADGADGEPPDFKREMATFALGAVFFALPVVPTEEMELMAAHAGPIRLVVIALASVGLAFAALYVIEFRGRGARHAAAQSVWTQLGETATGYVIALLVSALLLAGWGHFVGVSLNVAMQMVIVLAFLASLGGAAARVVI